MREVLAARSGRDGLAAGPAPRARGRAASPSIGALVLARLAARPAAVLGTLVVTACGAAIAINALAFQEARHPAPLFIDKHRQHAEPYPPPARRAEAPARVEPSAQPLPASPPLPPARPAVPATAAIPAPAAPPAPPPRRDQIGDLLRGGEATGAVVRPVAPSPDPSRQVAGAQRALVRLGYGPLTADGVMGPATRTAIERFERDRRLAATGELNPRTARELASASGLSLD